MIKTLIIDDELHCIATLQELLESHTDHFKVVGSCQSVAEGLSLSQMLVPDLVFLDVQIGDKTGFDFLRSVPNLNFDVIFTTAYEKYAVQAFKFSASDYLLKPIAKEDFDSTVIKYREGVLNRDIRKKMELLLHNMSHRDSPKKISVPTLEGYEFLEIADIIRCQADVNYTHIFLKGNQKLTVSKTLKSFEEMLEPLQFFRVHNSHLINLKHVKKYSKGKGGYVLMDDHTAIEVSTRRKEEFLKQMGL